MSALSYYLTTVAPTTGMIGMAICFAGMFINNISAERVGMWVCIIAAGEFITLYALGGAP